MNLLDKFEFVVSGDTCAEKKPSPMPLLFAAEKMGVSPENALMIGDSISDVKAARAAHFHIICMSYGYNHGRPIAEEHPAQVLDCLSGLLRPAANALLPGLAG
jgi:phosphoglycolate phosphatase